MYPAVLSLLHLNTIVETVLNFFLKFPFKLYFDQLLLWFITLCDFFFKLRYRAFYNTHRFRGLPSPAVRDKRLLITLISLHDHVGVRCHGLNSHVRSFKNLCFAYTVFQG